MSKMRVIVNVGVAFDVETYQEAGEILDRIDGKLAKVLAGKGKHEITGFQTRPCKAAKFDQIIDGPQMAYAEPDMAEMPVRERGAYIG
jgi:hypothetical protein